MYSKNRYKLYLGYVLIIILSFFISHFIAYGWFINLFDQYTGATTITLIIYFLSLLNISDRNPLTFIYFIKLTSSIGMAGVFSGALFYYIRPWKFAPRALFFMAFIILLLVYIYRVLIYFFSKKDIENVMIIGTGRGAKLIGDTISRFKNLYKLVGYIDYERSQYEDLDPKKVYREIDKIEEVLNKNRVDHIVLARELEQDDQLLKNVVDMKMLGYNVVYMANLYEFLEGKVPIKYINNNWFINSNFYAIYNRFYRNIKRLSDVFISLISLLLLSPILFIVSFLIKITDFGPVFFKQKRVGQYGKIFDIYKFRTMCVGAEKGDKYTQKNDSRITKIGKFLRKTRIDEIPQFINVLKGDMSVIGPRAEWDKLVEEYKNRVPFYSIRHTVKPGITGWAQVEYRYGASMEDTFEKLQYDLYYIKHQSILLDFEIMFKTAKVILKMGGR